MNTTLNSQCLLGLACKQFTMVAADQMQLQSIFVMKNDAKKLFEITDNIVLGLNGEAGDISQFTHFIKQNMALYRMRNCYDLSTRAAVHFTRKTVTDALRTPIPCLFNILLAGYEKPEGGQLYSIDYLGTCVRVPFCVHGFAGILCSSIFDIHYKPNMTEEAAFEVLVLCISEIQQRLCMNLPNFQVKVVDRNGIRDLPNITAPGILVLPQ